MHTMDSFFNFLDRLREKPDAVKAQVAFGTAFVIAGCIAVVWGTTLPARFADNEGLVAETGKAVTNDETGLFSSLGDAFTSVRTQIGSIIESTSTESEEVPDIADAEQEADETFSGNKEKTIRVVPQKAEEPRTILIATSSEKEEE